MMRLAASHLMILTIAGMTSGCYRTRHHAPPPPPPRIEPTVDAAGTPGYGLTRVALDVEGGPALVERVQGGSVAGNAGSTVFGASLSLSRTICVTPCVFDAPPGNHELRFTSQHDPSRTSQGFITVGQEPLAYRHRLGVRRNKAWKGFVGWPVLTLGVLVDLTALTAMNDRWTYSSSDQVRAGIIGVGLTALGVWLVRGAVIEHQPGSGTQWLLPQARSGL